MIYFQAFALVLIFVLAAVVDLGFVVILPPPPSYHQQAQLRHGNESLVQGLVNQTEPFPWELKVVSTYRQYGVIAMVIGGR